MKIFIAAFFLLAITIGWVFLPSSSEQYLWFNGGSVKVNGNTVNAEVISHYDESNEQMWGTVYITYPMEMLNDDQCLLTAALEISGLNSTEARSFDYPNRQVLFCSSDDSQCTANLENAKSGRIHLYFSQTRVSEIQIAIQSQAKESSSSDYCSSDALRIVKKPKWRRASRWDRWSSV